MGVNMELEFDKYCKVGRSPRTVLPVPHPQTKGEKKNKTEKPCFRNDGYDLLSLEEEGFTELKFRNYRSVSCKNLPSGKDVEVQREKVLRRGSVCQTSRERKSRREETSGGRKKIEFSLGNEASFSFSILDSICGSDNEEAEVEPLERKKSSVLSLDLKERQSDCGKSAQRDSMGNRKFKCDQVSGPSNSGNVLKERDAFAFNKSLSSKLVLPHSPTHSDGNSSYRSSKSRFTPIKKMFDPIIKSKSHQKTSNASKSTIGKSILHDFSSVTPNVGSSTQIMKKDRQPAHLNGNLKMEEKHGVPYFEFSMTQSQDVFVAKTWKEEDALNWVYTFHSVQGKRRSNSTPGGIKYSNKDSPMVGQMQVSCSLCSEQREGGGFGDSKVAEFVLYNIAHARKSASDPEDSKVPANSHEGPDVGDVELDDLFSLAKSRMPNTSSSVDFSSPYPWAPSDLDSSLEIAAVVVRVPFEKREGLKHRRGEKLSHGVHLGLSSFGQGTRSKLDDHSSLVKVNVVTPLGNHGVPLSDESRRPLPLLKRWRLGGGCDCGGWDMACPLLVLGNPVTQSMLHHSILEKDQPLRLYVQGGKESMPALTITTTGKSQYSVDFHAQLSTLQVFAICVAILHTTDASGSVEQEKLLQCTSLKALFEDQLLIEEVVTAEEREKVTKVAEENPHSPSFVINPPFSPIARV